MKLTRKIIFLLLYLPFYILNAQEALPIYSDYLTDNYYLIHPSMAGVANCNKARLTGREQWMGLENAPSLQTFSVNGRIGDSQSAVGAILYNDQNGYHSQTGAYLTYAHHLMFSRNTIDLNMLSFGLSAGLIQRKLDETSFLLNGGNFDPYIAGIVQSSSEFNVDFGFSYHFINFYAHATIKNLLKNDGVNINDTPNGLAVSKFDNLTNYLISLGNVFSKYGSDWSFEPSLLFSYKDGTEESFMDYNFKTYRDFEFGSVFIGISYRRSFDGADFSLNNGSISSQKLQYITPIVGMEYNNFMFAYTYSNQSNTIVLNNGGYHQLTLGFNFGCRKEKYDCECPSVN
ncbi:MAG: type IX secretion system membrane protein PorP/SprF [Flavobacteriaceae bacterium]|tara:strand:- start:1307 stop:2338 length:1032 start_codon:yes stop_codon:yes gene_type:complete